LISDRVHVHKALSRTRWVHFNKWARGGIIEGREKRGGKRDEEKTK
jgi:hypothetical protein